MKIAVVHNQFSKGGGMEAYMLALIRGFIIAGDEVHVHTYEVDRRLAAGLPCIVHKSNLFFLPRRWKKYYFLRYCNRHFNRNAYDLSLSLTRTCGPQVAVVGGVHPASVQARSGVGNVLRRFHDRIETALERDMFLRTCRIVTHSKELSKEVSTFYPQTEPEKISVLYPPIDTDFFTRTEGEELRRTQAHYSIFPEKMTLLFPSTGHKRKGLEELLVAFSRLDPKRFELLVVGERLRGFASVPKNVRYLGYIDNLSALYSAVDYTVLPARYEPFGLVATESLHCGTPVLVTCFAGVSELLSDQEGVVLDDNHPDTLTSVISGLRRRRVAPGFVERHDLSIARHIALLKALRR